MLINSTHFISFSFASTFGSAMQNEPSATTDKAVASDADNLFHGLNICKPSSAADATTVTSTSSTATTGGLFSLSSFSSPDSQSKSIFSNASTVASPFGGGVPATATTISNSPFVGGAFASNTSTTPTKSIFGDSATVTEPSAVSPFSGATGTSFGALRPPNSSPFGTPGLPFGGALAPAQQPATTATATSPFGGSGTSLFGNGTSSFGQPTAAAGNAFGQANTAQSGSSIFGGSSVFGGQQTAGGNASIFGGGSATNPAFGGFGGQQPSAFGGATASGGPFSSGGGVGSFMQGGPSIAQTGFGAPNTSALGSPPQTAFQAVAATAPIFGAQPAFGGAATFGSPKSGFGTFANVQASPTGAVAASGNSLFASLGASENTMTFGNIAQASAPAAAAAPNSAFGGG